MKLSIQAGATSQTVNIFIQDSSSTTGAGLTGLAYNTSSLTAYYALPKAAATSITLATLAAVTSSYSSGGFKEIDATNMPGWYRFDIPDAALASGRFVSIHLKGATNMAPLPIEIELTAWNNQDATRGGLTALPNANASAVGGLPVAVDTSGRVDVLKINGTSQTARDIGASVLVSSGTGTGQISLSSGIANVALTNTGIDAILDRTDGVETSWTLRQSLRLMLSSLAGKLSGAGTTTITIRDMADSKNRVSATVDSDGNRSAVTRDAS